MLSDIKLIKSTPFSELVSSEKVLTLLKVYSELYLNGQNPGGCEKCLRTYYNQIMQNVEQQLIIYEEIKKRTLIPNWKDVKYISGAFYDSATITDKIALSALKHGFLKESNFIKLPDGYKVAEIAIEQNTPIKSAIRGRKKK